MISEGNVFPSRISRWYYRHGLRCASHPQRFLALTALLVTICGYPLWRLSTTGSHHFDEGGTDPAPEWFKGPPLAYVQQIIVRSMVYPWNSGDSNSIDAYRAPLYTSFKVSEIVTNHQSLSSTNKTQKRISLHDLCLQVQESSSGSSGLLPQYSCLVVSPALIWHRDPQRFLQDPHIFDSLFGLRETKELFFGLPWRETGLRKSSPKGRRQVLSYAVTLLLERYDESYINSLEEALMKQFPLSRVGNSTRSKFNSHLHFRYVHHLAEFLPLTVVYLAMAFYVYFSLSKVALLRSKFLLASATVGNVILSTVIAIGICLWLRLNPTLNGNPLVSPRANPCVASEILPYLLVIIGLENSLCITNSVVNCTPRGAKIHLAQGLSREGWSLVKTLLTELSLLTVAFFTFVPVIQEFCLYALIGVVTDYVLQHTFFATLLSLDLQRKEKDDERTSVANPRNHNRMARVFAGPTQSSVLDKVPRRLRLLYIWTKFRFVQRSLMAIMIVWIVLLVQHSGIIETFRPLPHNFTSNLNLMSVQDIRDKLSLNLPKEFFKRTEGLPQDQDADRPEKEFSALRCQKSTWKNLPTLRWTTLFGFYNMSLWGRYITVLPEIHVAIPIARTEAVKFRHPEDSVPQFYPDWSLLPEPNESLEALARPLFILLTIPTFFFLVYLLAVLYRCVCTRNYAEWRTQWYTRGLGGAMVSPDDLKVNHPLFHETFPIRLSGHSLPVTEIACSDYKNTVVSASVDGEIRVWDGTNGGCLQTIKSREEGRVWAMTCYGNWLIVSTVRGGIGRLELWHALEGKEYSTVECESPVISIATQGRLIMAASMAGQLSSFVVDVDSHRKTCLVSNGAVTAHSNPVTAMCFPEGSHVLTGSLDRLVKVFSIDELQCVYTLHGHAGVISGLCADERQAVSACLHGMLCLWDLLTGTCIYSLDAHKGAISSVRLNALYVISCSETEGRFRVWERTQGHLLHSRQAGCRQMELLSDDVLVTAAENILLWDVHCAEQIQMVQLGGGLAIRVLRKAHDNLICDSGHDLCVVFFPALTKKVE